MTITETTLLTDLLLKEMEQEAITTRKMLALVPEDKWDWKPHPKSMTLMQLSTHVAELPTWTTLAVNTEVLDFAVTPYTPVTVATNAELLKFFEDSFASGREALSEVSDEDLKPTWILRNGEEIYVETTKGEMVRISISQTIHHRAQLGVYLRLLNIPIPGSYGPSADELGL